MRGQRDGEVRPGWRKAGMSRDRVAQRWLSAHGIAGGQGHGAQAKQCAAIAWSRVEHAGEGTLGRLPIAARHMRAAEDEPQVAGRPHPMRRRVQCALGVSRRILGVSLRQFLFRDAQQRHGMLRVGGKDFVVERPRLALDCPPHGARKRWRVPRPEIGSWEESLTA